MRHSRPLRRIAAGHGHLPAFLGRGTVVLEESSPPKLTREGGRRQAGVCLGLKAGLSRQCPEWLESGHSRYSEGDLVRRHAESHIALIAGIASVSVSD